MRPGKRCLWLNNDEVFPLPNRRDTIRNGGKQLEVYMALQAEIFLALCMNRRLRVGRLFLGIRPPARLVDIYCCIYYFNSLAVGDWMASLRSKVQSGSAWLRAA